MPFTCTHDLITDCIAIWHIIQRKLIDIEWVHIAQRTIILRCEIMSKINLLVICRNDTYGWGWGSIEINIWGRIKKSQIA